MKSVLTVGIIFIFLGAQARTVYARQYRGSVKMRGPIQGRRVRMRAPVYRARRNPHANIYDDQARFNSFKSDWGSNSDRYNWNYRFKDIDSTTGYHYQGNYDQRGYYQQ